MTDPALNGNLPQEETEELVDYEEEADDQAGQAKAGEAPAKKGYVGIHSTGFKDFLLKPELVRAIVDCGFEHPSEGERARNCLGAAALRPSLPWAACQASNTDAPSPCAQCSTSASRRPSWAWMSCARPSLGWARQPCSCCPCCSSWSL